MRERSGAGPPGSADATGDDIGRNAGPDDGASSAAAVPAPAPPQRAGAGPPPAPDVGSNRFGAASASDSDSPISAPPSEAGVAAAVVGARDAESEASSSVAGPRASRGAGDV